MSEIEALKLALSTNTRCAELSTIAVFIGLIADIVVIIAFDLFDTDKSWLEIGLAGLASVVIAVGVYGEWRFGHRASEASSKLQTVLENDTAHANERASNAERDAFNANALSKAAESHLAEANARAAEANAKAERFRLAIAQAQADGQNARLEEEKLRAENGKFERFVSGRQIEEDDEFQKLRRFAGTTRWIQRLSPYPSVPHTEAEALAWRTETDEWMRSDFEIGEFVRSLLNLQYVGWNPLVLQKQINGGPYSVNIHVLSPRCEPHALLAKCARFDDFPYSVPIDTPERKAYAAASALTKYLADDLEFKETQHLPIDTPTGAKADPTWADLPSDAVVITIGKRDVQTDLQMRQLYRGLRERQDE